MINNELLYYYILYIIIKIYIIVIIAFNAVDFNYIYI